jgi:hypothetical protein
MGRLLEIRATVKELLYKFPKTRDDDRLLILKVWAEQDPDLKHDSYSFRRFAYKYLDYKFADTESIRRSRQILQKEYPELQGEKYKQRHGKEQDDWKEDVNTPDGLPGGNP